MPTECYRIHSPIMALFERNGRHMAETVPVGAIVEIDTDTFDGNRLVDVIWVGKPVMMFTQDLRTRGESIEAHTK
jgi:hypothetical protein